MKILKRIILYALLLLMGYAFYYAWRAAPILTGYGTKVLCSCTMVGGRSANDVINVELGSFPMSLGTFQFNPEDSSTTGSVFGLAGKKAIYRKGLGCTLINEITEEELRRQSYHTYEPVAADPDTIPWPYGDKLDQPIPEGIDQEQLRATVTRAFRESGKEKLRNTRAVIVVYKGVIVAESYGEGFNRKSMHMGWSMTKGITNAVVGILIRQGRLSIDQPAPVDLWKQDDRKTITLNHLLHASSGLEWVELYGGPSDATNMLFKKKDMGLFAATHPLKDVPGARFYYSSGTTNLISRIIRQAIGDDGYYGFYRRELFSKIGATSIVVEPDAGGTFVGSSYAFGTARDWARFGLLFLNDGMANGERILPEGWVLYTTRPAPGAGRGQYGAQFWLNAGSPEDPSDRLYPDIPPDLYFADGFAGQNIFILPSRKLVVVKLSESHGDFLDDSAFLAAIISALPQ